LTCKGWLFMTSKATSVIVLIICLGKLALCQVSPPLSVFPLTTYLEIGPGDTFSGSFNVKNGSSEAVAINVTLVDFMFDEKGNIFALEPGTIGDQSLSPYVTNYSPENTVLGPGESCKVRFSLTIPLEAIGPHWAAFVVSPEKVEDAEIEKKTREGLAFLVRLNWTYFFTIVQSPPSSEPPAGQVIGMEVQGATGEDGSRKLTVTLTFQNLVNDVLRCKVYFEVRDAAGERLVRYDFPHEMMVLPQMVRNFHHTFEGLNWDPGEYLILGVVDFGGDYLAAGQYLAMVRE